MLAEIKQNENKISLRKSINLNVLLLKETKYKRKTLTRERKLKSK